MSKRMLLTVCAGVLTMVATSAFADFKQIKTADQFNSTVVGKKLVDEHGNTFVMNANGAITAKLKKGKFSGSWVWNGKYWCRNGVFNGKELGTDCQKVEVDGSAVRFVRNKGKGENINNTMK
jgi:hypothetical protein